ncbi:Uncharacterised protein [Klebsiella pneumoniae]|nr:Uncharacterised protein [Klebsiella pneumoniae]
MAKQHHKADADHDVAEEGGVIGIQAIDMDKVTVQVREQGHQSDRAEGFQREGGAHPPDREPVEWQVNDEEDHAKRQVGGIVDQKGHARRPAGQGASLAK